MPKTTRLIVTAEIVESDDLGNVIVKSKNVTTSDFSKDLNYDIKVSAENGDSAISVTKR